MSPFNFDSAGDICIKNLAAGPIGLIYKFHVFNISNGCFFKSSLSSAPFSIDFKAL